MQAGKVGNQYHSTNIVLILGKWWANYYELIVEFHGTKWDVVVPLVIRVIMRSRSFWIVWISYHLCHVAQSGSLEDGGQCTRIGKTFKKIKKSQYFWNFFVTTWPIVLLVFLWRSEFHGTLVLKKSQVQNIWIVLILVFPIQNTIVVILSWNFAREYYTTLYFLQKGFRYFLLFSIF